MSDANASSLQLQDGSRVAVIGGGPAGSFFAYFLLQFAQRLGLDLTLGRDGQLRRNGIHRR